MYIDKKNIIKEFVKRTINTYGSDVQERAMPGSKLEVQAQHIADFVEQLDDLEKVLSESNDDELRFSMLHNLKIVWSS